jgi:hypothetical protein
VVVLSAKLLVFSLSEGLLVSQTDVHSERIDEPTLPEVWLRDVEIACYSSVLGR